MHDKKFTLSEIAHLRDLFDEKLARRDVATQLAAEALRLQAGEYERRLAALNHEHEKNKERNAEFVGTEKFEAFVKDAMTYRESTEKSTTEKSGNLEKSVREKAEALEKSVREKAEALEKSVNEKSELLKGQFQAFKVETEKSTERVTGTKLGSNKVLALVVSIVGFIWATSSVISTVQTVLSNMKTSPPPASEQSIKNSAAIEKLQETQAETSRLADKKLAERLDALESKTPAAKPTPSPMPVTVLPASSGN